MKTTKIIPFALLMTSVAISGVVSAHDNDQKEQRDHSQYQSNNDCNLDLKDGVTVTPKFVKVFDSNKTLFQIEKDGTMTVNGQSVALTATQQQISADYANGIRNVVPEAIEMATKAMDVATTGVNTAMTALFGENSEMEGKINGIIDNAKQKINANINKAGDEYTIAPNSFDNLEEAFGEEFEKDIEDMAMSSMGSIFSLMGEAMSNGEGDFKQRMEAFGEKMEAMGDNLEKTMEAQADQLEQQAEGLCLQLKEVDKLETQLQQQVAQFAKVDFINLDDSDHKRHHRRHNRHHDDDEDSE